MDEKEEGLRPFVEDGSYFKNIKDDRDHIVCGFKGVIIDERGKEHPIEDCMSYFWTKKDIEKVNKRSENLCKAFGILEE